MRNKLIMARNVATTLFLVVGSLSLIGAVGCKSPTSVATRRGEVAPDKPGPTVHIGPNGRRRPQYEAVSTSVPKIAGAELVNDDSLCMTCHEAYAKAHRQDVHMKQSCETCHGPASQHLRTRGQEPGLILSFKTMQPGEKAGMCLACHEKDACSPGQQWRTSAHANAGVSCTDCHKSHYNVPAGTPSTKVASAGTAASSILPVGAQEPKKDALDMEAIRHESRALGAKSQDTCYRCHQQKRELEQVAHPHQICGAVGMNCTTCHEPHGNIRAETRTDLCLKCHKGHPTMAWKSSIHSQYGVACVDCHNPHPSTEVPGFVDIQHTHVRRPKRMPMSVEEPFVCYQCHAKTAAEFELPSHHPVREGKLVCSSCHDSHGAQTKNLREPTVNLVCYRCHNEKSGPFVWEHPPVSENCDICHNPHGTVTNNLLKQPPTFLCLRCHAGHRGQRRDIDKVSLYRPAFYTDCSQCHSQVHGSDLPAATRNGPRLTR